MGIADRLTLFLATGFGLGRIPVAPGTFGTLAGLPFVWMAARLGAWPGASGLFLVCFILASVWVADRAERLMNLKDPGCIVIDEMAGYTVAMSLVPATPWTLAAGFAAFRCFDIIKPAPVRYFEKNFSGGAGVVLDDIMAGVLAGLLLKTVHLTGVL